MDDKRRDGLMAKLSEAIERKTRLEQQLTDHANNIEKVRESLGNPFYFHPRPDDHPESRAKYTGYASHDSGLSLIRACKDAEREISQILNHLGALAM